MDEDEKYFFDINGYIVVRGVLKAEEIAAANAAIDHYAKHIRERSGEQSLSGGSPALKGETGRGDWAYANNCDWPEAMLDGMSEEQRAVLEPPYHLRLDRPVLK